MNTRLVKVGNAWLDPSEVVALVDGPLPPVIPAADSPAPAPMTQIVLRSGAAVLVELDIPAVLARLREATSYDPDRA